MSIKSWLFFIPLLLLLISCEKAISFKPQSEEGKLVVEATIEDGRYPVVYLTNSLDFFSQISLQALTRSFVHDAVITISNSSGSQTLREYQLPIDSGYSLFYYSADTISAGNPFRGQFGERYDMSMQVGGKEYTASTTIPMLTKQINTLYFKTDVDKTDSSKISLFAKIADPKGLGNYTRYFTSVNNGPYLPGLNSVEDDQIVDGKSYDSEIDQGIDRNADIDFDNYAFFHKGDSIGVKYCNIDKATFDFWRTMEYSYSSIGNPFSSPTRVTGNISNGALGYFGGYAVQYSSTVIPR